jgi:hypothetical protein
MIIKYVSKITKRMKIIRSSIYFVLPVTLLTGMSMTIVTGLAQGQMFQTECNNMTSQTTEEDLHEVDPGITIDPFRFQKELQQRSDDFRNGWIIGAELGYLQRISDGSKDIIANAAANPKNNYTRPCVNDACAAFEDYYEIRCVLPNNFHPLVPYVGGNGSMVANFVQGYFNAYPDAYNAGYYTGYNLDNTVQPILGQS